MVISGLIQARMGSERLPGKVMLKIEGKPLIGHIFDRLKKVQGLKNLILATTKDKRNDILEKYAKKNNILVYRHDHENDIVGRIYEAFNKLRVDAMLKINADCPLIDVKTLQEGVDIFKAYKGGYDLVTNKISKTFPDGYSYEIVSYNAIKWCQENLTNPEERELVMLWIMKNKNIFPNIYSVKRIKNIGKLNLCVDTLSDLKNIKIIYKKLYHKNKYFGLEEVLSIVST